MRFLFECEDVIALPAAYKLVDDVKPFLDKIKKLDFEEGAEKGDRMTVFKRIVENIMVKYPGETSRLLARLWVLDEGEKAPNSFKTMATLFKNEVAIDFFTSVLPSLLQISREVSPLLK